MSSMAVFRACKSAASSAVSGIVKVSVSADLPSSKLPEKIRGGNETIPFAFVY